MTGHNNKPLDPGSGKPPGGGPPETVVAKIKAKRKNIPAAVFAGVDDKKDDVATRKELAKKLLAWMRGNGHK